MRRLAAAVIAGGKLWAAAPQNALLADDSDRILTIDHYVRAPSTVPAIARQPAQLYVRERVAAGPVLRGGSLADRVVLFVHGAGTPAEVAFDVPYEGYSWMAYLAERGFDVFSVDMTGYGRSTRPAPMNDPCNLAADRQPAFVPGLLAGPCPQTYAGAMTTIASDWDDVGAAVDYVRTLRRVERVSLIAWSLGGPRSGGYAAAHPEKVNRLVWLAPAYNRGAPAAAPAKLPVPGTVFNTQSRAEFLTLWDRQVGCAAQYEPAVADAIWSAMLESDPVGATWGPGVRRAPQTTTWGWNKDVVAKMQTPALMVAGVHDKQVDPARVRELYSDLGAQKKVLVELGCASHNAMWEKGRTTLFRASLEWLEKGTVDGSEQGTLKLGNPQ
jgi:pimeloyl-ACP methyl ester carboxylesterase